MEVLTRTALVLSVVQTRKELHQRASPSTAMKRMQSKKRETKGTAYSHDTMFALDSFEAIHGLIAVNTNLSIKFIHSQELRFVRTDQSPLQILRC